MMKFIVSASLVMNGMLAGLIAGHLMTRADPAACRCECRKSGGERPRDRGPFPTGWVVPDVSPRPAGASQ